MQEQTLRAAGAHGPGQEGERHQPRGSTELATLLDFLRQGDTRVVTRIGRLARSIEDLQDIGHALK